MIIGIPTIRPIIVADINIPNKIKRMPRIMAIIRPVNFTMLLISRQIHQKGTNKQGTRDILLFDIVPSRLREKIIPINFSIYKYENIPK